jgi:hypothetical protein
MAKVEDIFLFSMQYTGDVLNLFLNILLKDLESGSFDFSKSCIDNKDCPQ